MTSYFLIYLYLLHLSNCPNSDFKHHIEQEWSEEWRHPDLVPDYSENA